MDKRAGAMLRLARRHTGARRNEWRNAWATYWLIRRCGLRNSEVDALRWEWFSHRENGIFLEMVRRPYWSPKGTEGELPVARELYRGWPRNSARPGWPTVAQPTCWPVPRPIAGRAARAG